MKTLPVKWPILLFAYSSLFSLGLIDNSRGPVYPFVLDQFKVDSSAGAGFFFYASVGSLISNLVFNQVTSFFGLIGSMRGALLMMGAGSIGIGLCSLLHANFFLLIIFSFVFGLGTGVAGVGMNIMVSKAVPFQARRKAYGGLHSLYGISSLIAPIIVNAVMAAKVAWEWHFVWIGIIPLLIAIFSFWKMENIFETGNQQSADNKAENGPRMLAAFCLAFYVPAEVLVSSRLVLLLTQEFGFSNSSAGFQLSLFFLFLLIGRLALALIHLPGATNRWLYGSLATSLATILLGQWHSPYFFCLTGLTMSIFFPCFMTRLSEIFGNSFDRVISFCMLIQLTGIAVFHKFVGILSDYIGLRQAMFTPALLCLLALIMIPLIEKSVKSD